MLIETPVLFPWIVLMNPTSKEDYKKYNSAAPLNEVLAAGMILMSKWDKKSDLVDPMCGTGTFLIEAAMIAKKYCP